MLTSFSDFLNEQNTPPLLNESVTFSPDGDTVMIGNLADFTKWYHYGYSGTAYTKDGKYSFRRSRQSHSLSVCETGNYGKSGTSNSYDIRLDAEADLNGKFIEAITDIDKIVDIAKSLESSGVVDRVYTSTMKNMEVSAFNPVMLKNFKSIGSIAKKDKITKSQVRKIVASGDFDNITHNYQMRDDNYSSDGAIKLTYGNIIQVLDALDSKHTSLSNSVGSESFRIYVHSNLTYYVNRD